jgi:hypothetical protein
MKTKFTKGHFCWDTL